jgi:N-acetyl-beta-hexosaminidase
MKRFFTAAFAAALFSTLALAETWNGTLVDVMCKGKDLSSHTKKCALGCAKSGYAVVLSDGKFLKLDEGGNAKALAALKASSKEKDLKVTVNGKLDGETIQVDSLNLD